MAWALAALAGAKLVADLSGGRKAGKATKARTASNIAALRAEADERIRRTELSQKQTVASTTASAGASGLSLKSKSTQGYLDEMKSNFKKDIDWMKKSRDTGAFLEGQRGADERDRIKRGMWGTAISGAGGIISGYNAPGKPKAGKI